MRTCRLWLRRCGFDLHRYAWWQDARERRHRLYKAKGIDLVLDVGANIGQFHDEIRRDGYGGDIISFEPLSNAIAERRRRAEDARWQLRQLALDGHRIEEYSFVAFARPPSGQLLRSAPASLRLRGAVAGNPAQTVAPPAPGELRSMVVAIRILEDYS